MDKKGDCIPAQDAIGGPYSMNVTISAPVDLVPGDYTVTISGSATEGLTLPSPMPSIIVTVEPAGIAPSVNIIQPASGSAFIVNQKTTISVEIISDIALLSVSCLLDGSPITLDYNSENGMYESETTLSQPGPNTLMVTAVNAAGMGEASSTFSVRYYPIGSGDWLPPITTSRFQCGRNLPVKFVIRDYNGPTGQAAATVNGQDAYVLYDSAGSPYYQCDLRLPSTAGPFPVTIAVDDMYTTATKTITLK